MNQFEELQAFVEECSSIKSVEKEKSDESGLTEQGEEQEEGEDQQQDNQQDNQQIQPCPLFPPQIKGEFLYLFLNKFWNLFQPKPILPFEERFSFHYFTINFCF